ncbi:hypothetical protein GCM10010116_18600 [Microbispora rosea subsp. aerata]|nr:hypothetical protein [Microbispora rosea]GGO09192.1 hypothetical protein GCM10010116_18600 [Microbispora rosea subsp. aerata]GIH53524.1 hypothetical protein Mro02_04380 [Microbispora rosea subsp. aerata]GLJ85427.1 hypothetical protein GCM10017588_41600 [Microbispora rosea subsp. aerata]
MTRRLIRRAVPLCVLSAGLLAGLLPRATSVAHAHAWTVRAQAERSPSGDEVALDAGSSTGRLQPDGSLSDVAGLSAGDVWAVGQQNAWDFWRNQGVITHFDGSSWSEVQIRGDATGAGHLRSVAAASAGEIWVVGDGHDGLPYVAKGSRDGFDRVGVPQLRTGDWLGGVAAASGKVIAVGSRDGRALLLSSGGSTKGTAWKTAQGPEGALYGVAIAGRSDGWAVGDTGTEPLAMRLTGSGWKRAALPHVKGGFLRDVYADGRKSAVAIGGVYQSGGGIAPLVLRWDGKTWKRVTPPEHRAELYGVTGDGDGVFWISGYDPEHPAEGLLLRFDGSRWTALRGRTPAEDRTVRLQAVAHVEDLTLAVGHMLDDKGRYTDLVARFGPPAAEDTTLKAAGEAE